MKKSTARATATFIIAAVVIGTWAWWRRSHREPARVADAKTTSVAAPVAAQKAVARVEPRRIPPLSPTMDKAAQIKAILHDYEEIQSKMSADYGAAGERFPGGLRAFLRELALIDREKRADLAKVMAPRELEDYEIGTSAAGQKMRAALDGTVATDEQRRAVFRTEQDFNDKFGFTFDLSPQALAVREAARIATQRQVRDILGDALFAGWLQQNDPNFGHFVEFAQENHLPAGTAIGLLMLKNNFIMSALDIASAPPEAVAQRRAALLELGRMQARGITATLPAEVIDREVASWLKQPPPR